MQGWVKLHREMQANAVWTSTTAEQKVIFFTLLMLVNHAANSWEWNGDKYHVEPGQTITSIQSICQLAGKGITPQKVKTALKKFKKWQILTDKATKQGRLITLLNWGKYQHQEQIATNELTIEQPTINQQLTTNKNERTERIKELGTGNFPGENSTVSFYEYRKQNPVSEEVTNSINSYLVKFKRYQGSEHMKLKPETWQDITDTLLMTEDEYDHGIELFEENLSWMTDHYFSKDYNNGDCNRCITHFNNPGIKKVNFYEAVLKGGEE